MSAPLSSPKIPLTKPVIVRDEPITPPSVMLLGDIGSGKTSSIISALKAGLEVFVLVTENTGVESLIDACKREKADSSRLHWKRCTPTRQGWGVMKAQAKLTNTMSVGEIQEMKVNLDRFKYPAFMTLLEACENFVCDRDKQQYGDVMTWDDSRMLVVDSLSGINEIVSSHVTGHRITMTQPEFGVVQNHIYNLINTFCGMSCFFVITGHIEAELDEAKGVTKLMASTVGKKLGPKLPRLFSEVILAKEQGGKYIWTAQDPRVATKTRALPKGDMAADFGLLLKIYNERKQEAAKELTATTA